VAKETVPARGWRAPGPSLSSAPIRAQVIVPGKHPARVRHHRLANLSHPRSRQARSARGVLWGVQVEADQRLPPTEPNWTGLATGALASMDHRTSEEEKAAATFQRAAEAILRQAPNTRAFAPSWQRDRPRDWWLIGTDRPIPRRWQPVRFSTSRRDVAPPRSDPQGIDNLQTGCCRAVMGYALAVEAFRSGSARSVSKWCARESAVAVPKRNTRPRSDVKSGVV